MELPHMMLLGPAGLPGPAPFLLLGGTGAATRGVRRATVGAMSPRRPAVLLLLTLTAALVACGDDDPDVTAGSTSTAAPATETTAPPPTDTTTTQAPGTTGPPTTAPVTTLPVDPSITCESDTTLSADADGDGAADTIALVSDPSTYTSALEVCTATGGHQLDALGASTVEATDLDGDGAVEILYGGTAATSKTVQVARIVDGDLVTVTVDGAPLVLVDGFPDGTPPDGPRHAYGCPGELSGTPVHVVALQVTPLNAVEHTFQLEAVGFVLDGPAATVADTQSVSSAEATPGGTPEELIAYAQELVDANAPAC
jgi:hypothetical protein